MRRNISITTYEKSKITAFTKVPEKVDSYSSRYEFLKGKLNFTIERRDNQRYAYNANWPIGTLAHQGGWDIV